MQGATSTSDPFCTISTIASLSANTTYKIHTYTSTNMQIFYAINKGYSETYSFHPSAGSSLNNLNATSAGDYRFRFDPPNITTAMTLKQFWISENKTQTSYTQALKANQYYQIPIPTREGYTFSGWTASDGITITSDGVVTMTAPGTVTANWTLNTYKVTVKSNNADFGTVSNAGDITVSQGTSYSVNNNVLTVGGNTYTATVKTDTAQYDYSFTGWSHS